MDKFVIKQKAGNTEDQNNISDNSANKVSKTDTKQTAADATDLKLLGLKPQTASVKTVRKWEKELDYEISKTDDNLVVQIWCRVSRHHSHDKTSSVRYFLLSVRLEKRGCNER